MDVVRQRLIDVTISLGGSNESNRDFSTNDIARKANISEPTLFSRFPTKDLLMDAATLQCVQNMTVYARSLLILNPTYEEFIDKMVSHQIDRREETIYLLNYAHTVDHGLNPEESPTSYRKIITDNARDVMVYFSFKDDIELFLAAGSLFRQLLFTALYIINGIWPNTKEVRHNLATITYHGAQAYFAGKAVPHA